MDFFTWAIIILASISTLITLAESIGLLPHWITLWINKNRLSNTLMVLEELGIDLNVYKRKIKAANIPTYFDSNRMEQELIKALKGIRVNGKIMVGSTESASSPYYIDLMGASTNEKYATLFARYLSTFWSRLVESEPSIQSKIDFIVTPKLGSPILAYEFAKILKKPLALSVEKQKFGIDGKPSFHQYFDLCPKPQEGSTALLVDDSTTGGRMAMSTIEKLKQNGYKINDFIVIFEPTLKNAREKILAKGVNLHSIVKMPFGE